MQKILRRSSGYGNEQSLLCATVILLIGTICFLSITEGLVNVFVSFIVVCIIELLLGLAFVHRRLYDIPRIYAMVFILGFVLIAVLFSLWGWYLNVPGLMEFIILVVFFSLFAMFIGIVLIDRLLKRHR